jgi:ferredoxin
LRRKIMPAVVDKEKCTGAGECVKVCPVEAIKLNDEKAVVDPDKCIECGACLGACPAQAITL